MATRNRDIVYVLRMRNEARAALRAYRGDLQSAAQATAEATRQAKEMARQTKSLETVMRRTGTSAGSIAGNMTLATNAIRTANRELARFSSASNQSAKAGQSLATAAQSISSTSAALKNMNSALSNFAKAAERTGILAQKLNDGAVAVRGATVALKNATREATAFAKASQQAGDALDRVSRPKRVGGGSGGGVFSQMLSEIGRVKAAILALGAAFAGAFAIKSLFNITDEFTAMNSQLRLVTTSTQQLTNTYAQLFAMAQNTRQSLSGTVDLYARITRAMQSLDMSQKEVLQLTDAINKSVAIFGGPAASAEAALFQLSQGFAAGQLRGEELNSVLEQSPRLAQAIADGMGVAVGSLRTLAEQGQMTSDKVLKAIMSQREKLDREFAQIGVTVGQAFTVWRNSVVDYIGRTDQATKTSQTFSRSVIDATKILRDPALVRAGTQAMELLGKAMVGAADTAVYLAQNLELVGAAIGAIVAYMARGFLVPLAQGFIAASTAVLTLVRNFNVLNLALLATQARLRVIQMLLSPAGIGVGVMAIGSLLGYWLTKTSDTQRATDMLADSVQRVRDAYSTAGDNVDALRKKVEGLTATQALVNAETAKNAYASAKNLIGTKADYGLGYENYQDAEGTAGGKQISALIDQLRKGTIEVEDFQKKVDEIGKSTGSAGLRDFAKQVLDMAADIKQSKDEADRWNDIVIVLTGTAEEAAKAVERLGIKTEEAGERAISAANIWSSYDNAVKALGNLNSADKKRNERVATMKKAQEEYNKAVAELTRLQKLGEISVMDYTAGLDDLKKKLQAAKDETYDLVDARKKLKEYETDSRIAGIFDERKRAIEQEKKAYEELVKTLEHATQAERDRAKAAYDARIASIEGQSRYDLAKSLSEQLRDMAQEAKVIGRTTAEKQRLVAIMNVENAAREAGVSNVKEFVDVFTTEYDKISKVVNEGKFAESMGDQIKKLKEEALTAGVASDRVEKLTKLIEFENEARDAGITNVEKYRNMYIAALDEVKAAQDAVNKNFALGFGEGLRSFGEEATNLRSQAKDLGSGIAGDISSALKNGLKTGKFDLRDMLSNIAGRFIDIGVDNLVGSISKALGGAFDDGMSNNPVAKAKQIVDQQQNAYLMTVNGVKSAGDNFVLQLSAVYQGIVASLSALLKNGTTAGLGVGTATSPNVPSTVKELGDALRSSSSAVGAIEAAAKAIKTIESGSAKGNYQALGPVTKSGDRAYGAYQMMGNNIPQWSQAALGRQVSIQEFLQSNEIQDAIFKHRFGGYMNKYGAEGASRAWFAGEGGMKNKSAQDVLGTSVGQYGSLFSKYYDQNGGMQQLQTQLQQVGTAAQTAAQATQTVNTAYTATGQNTQTAATAVTDLANSSQQAAQTMQTAGQNMQSAGQSAQNAGMNAKTANGDMGFFAQGISSLLGPLNQVVPGLGSFAQAIMGLLSQLGDAGGGGGGGFLGGLLGLFFANGGVMSPNGKVPLKAYSRGGIAKSPQLAVFGEGRQNEAYVPLPDGKSIPVAMHGGGGGGVNVGDISIDIKMQGSSGDTDKDREHAQNTANQINKMLDEKISSWALRESKPGGMLSKTGR